MPRVHLGFMPTQKEIEEAFEKALLTDDEISWTIYFAFTKPRWHHRGL